MQPGLNAGGVRAVCKAGRQSLGVLHGVLRLADHSARRREAVPNLDVSSFCLAPTFGRPPSPTHHALSRRTSKSHAAPELMSRTAGTDTAGDGAAVQRAWRN